MMWVAVVKAWDHRIDKVYRACCIIEQILKMIFCISFPTFSEL